MADITIPTGCKVAGHEKVSMAAADSDTYCLAKQWLYAYEHKFEITWGHLSEAPAQIVQLVSQILVQGEADWPAASYPPFTKAELEVTYGLWHDHPEMNLNDEYATALTVAAGHAAP